jgi:hypothetical protein
MIAPEIAPSFQNNSGPLQVRLWDWPPRYGKLSVRGRTLGGEVQYEAARDHHAALRGGRMAAGGAGAAASHAGSA